MRNERAASSVAYAAFLMLAIFPIWWVSHPPLNDYPNHLARMYIISHAGQSPINNYYEIKWAVIPNLAMDVVVPFLNQVVPLDVAAKLFITLIFFLLTAGSLILSRVIFGRTSPLAFASFLLLYNKSFEMGFLNFLFSCGLALIAISLWIALSLEGSWRRSLFGIFIAPILFFSHLYGLAIYAFFTLAYELWSGAGNQGVTSLGWLTCVDRARIWLPQFLLPAVLFVFFSPTVSGVGLLYDVKGIYWMVHAEGWISSKLSAISYVLPGYQTVADVVTAACLAAILLQAAIRERRSIPIYPFLPVCFAIGMYFFVPPMMLSGTAVDWRVLVPLAFVTISAIPCTCRSKLEFYGILGLIGILLLLQIDVVVSQWREGERLYSDYKAIAQRIPTGARLFPYSYSLCSNNEDINFPIPVQHLVSFAVIDRQAFVPSLFTSKAQQVLRLRDHYRDDSKRSGIVSYCPSDIDWDYIAAHFDFAINLDGDFGAFAKPPGWLTVLSAGRLALLKHD